MGEVEIISLNKRCNKTVTKADANTGVKVGSKDLKERYLILLREQLSKMIGRVEKVSKYCLRKMVEGQGRSCKTGPIQQ